MSTQRGGMTLFWGAMWAWVAAVAETVVRARKRSCELATIRAAGSPVYYLGEEAEPENHGRRRRPGLSHPYLKGVRLGLEEE